MFNSVVPSRKGGAEVEREAVRKHENFKNSWAQGISFMVNEIETA